MKRLFLPVAVLCFAPASWSGVLDDEYLRFGGGFGTVEADGAAHGTLQAFAGADTARQGPWRVGFEVSAMDASESDADGFGISGLLINGSVSGDVALFARAGADFGGDAGWLLGGGVGYFIERNMEVRFEMVSRPRGSGLQFNLAWYPRFNPHPE